MLTADTQLGDYSFKVDLLQDFPENRAGEVCAWTKPVRAWNLAHAVEKAGVLRSHYPVLSFHYTKAEI